MNIKIAETNTELEQAYHVRMDVFVEEQHVSPDIELDEHDATAIHFIGYDGEIPISASRLRFIDNYGKLERICVLKEHRGKSYGSLMIETMEANVSNKGYSKVKLNAQTHAIDFYQRLGYETVSGEFLDAGIPHVTMIKTL